MAKRFHNRLGSISLNDRQNLNYPTTKPLISLEACSELALIPRRQPSALLLWPLPVTQKPRNGFTKNSTELLEKKDVRFVNSSSATDLIPPGPRSAPTLADQNTLPQTMAFVLETFRWRPVSAGGFAHKATKDIVWVSFSFEPASFAPLLKPPKERLCDS